MGERGRQRLAWLAVQLDRAQDHNRAKPGASLRALGAPQDQSRFPLAQCRRAHSSGCSWRKLGNRHPYHHGHRVLGDLRVASFLRHRACQRIPVRPYMEPAVRGRGARRLRPARACHLWLGAAFPRHLPHLGHRAKHRGARRAVQRHLSLRIRLGAGARYHQAGDGASCRCADGRLRILRRDHGGPAHPLDGNDAGSTWHRNPRLRRGLSWGS